LSGVLEELTSGRQPQRNRCLYDCIYSASTVVELNEEFEARSFHLEIMFRIHNKQCYHEWEWKRMAICSRKRGL